MPRVLITGIQGQTGSYLAENYVNLGWDVHGTASVPVAEQSDSKAVLHRVNFSESGSLLALLKSTRPQVIVNLAAISSVAQSWESPSLTLGVNSVAVAEIAEFLSSHDDKITRVIQASSSEIFGDADVSPQTEATPIRPRNPYGVSKAASHLLGQSYRQAGFSWSNCILYNHESPRRPPTFLSRKVSMGVARIAAGLQESLELGSLSSRRDWGWAPDYAKAIELVASHGQADDLIIASGVDHSVEDYVREAFFAVGITDWQSRVIVNQDFIRPTETKVSVGDSSKLQTETGWRPTVTFSEMVKKMVTFDVELLEEEIE